MEVILEIFLLAIISAISVMACMKLAKLTKIPMVLYLMVIGVFLGDYGFGVANSIEIMPTYSAIAIVILFLVSAFGLNVVAIKNSGVKTLKLSSIPAIVEGLVVGVVAWALLSIFPVFDVPSINIAVIIAVMTVFAMSSPAIIIPFNMEGKQRGMKYSIFDELTIASVVDNFIPFPLTLIFLNIAVAMASGEEINFISILLQSVLMFLVLIVAGVITFYLGKLAGKLNNVVQNPKIIAVVLVLITIAMVFLTGSLGASIGIIYGFGFGLGYNVSSKEDVKVKVMQVSQQIYGLLLMPMVFIYVGTQIQVDQLLRPVTVLVFAIVTVVAIFVKGTVAKKVLKKEGSHDQEGVYASYGFAAKGIILINISLIISGLLVNNGYDYALQTMYMLAAISIIISVPYSSVKLKKQLDVLEQLDKE